MAGRGGAAVACEQSRRPPVVRALWLHEAAWRWFPGAGPARRGGSEVELRGHARRLERTCGRTPRRKSALDLDGAQFYSWSIMPAPLSPSKPRSLPKPRSGKKQGKKTAKKQTKKTAKRQTKKKNAPEALGAPLTAEVALAMLEHNLKEVEHLEPPILGTPTELELERSLDFIRPWFADTLGTLERSCGAQAPLTLAFSRVVSGALEGGQQRLREGSSTDVRLAPFAVLAAIKKRAVPYLQQYIGSLKAGLNGHGR